MVAAPIINEYEDCIHLTGLGSYSAHVVMLRLVTSIFDTSTADSRFGVLCV